MQKVSLPVVARLVRMSDKEKHVLADQAKTTNIPNKQINTNIFNLTNTYIQPTATTTTMAASINRRKLLLISNSTQHGGTYLEHCADRVKQFFSGCQNILFVPYALKDWDHYASVAQTAFDSFGLPIRSIHTYTDKKQAVEQADGIFISGGNTFRLLNQLYRDDIVQLIRERVTVHGVPYMGTSAGSNVACLTIKTTNDMPIVYPPSFDALQLVPFQINAHYIDPEKHLNGHMGETRDTRLREFHEENDTTVIGLREGAMLYVNGGEMKLWGINGGKLFVKGEAPVDLQVDEDLSAHL